MLPQSSTTYEHVVRYLLVALVTDHCTESVFPRSPSASAGETFASPSPMPAAFVINVFCACSDEGMRYELVAQDRGAQSAEGHYELEEQLSRDD